MIQKKTLQAIKDKWLLIDTNFLLDSLRYNGIYSPYYAFFREHGIDLVTIPPVLIEFYKGSQVKSHYAIKKEFLELRLADTLLLDERIIDNTFSMTAAYRDYAKTASATDLLLAGTLKKYRNNLLLFTANHKDFPDKLFDRVDYINISLDRDIRTYALVRFSIDKYNLANKVFESA